MGNASEAHVFGEALMHWTEGFRDQMEPRMKAAIGELPTILRELPLEWLHVDGDERLPVQLDRQKVISTLKLPFTDPANFWKLR